MFPNHMTHLIFIFTRMCMCVCVLGCVVSGYGVLCMGRIYLFSVSPKVRNGFIQVGQHD